MRRSWIPYLASLGVIAALCTAVGVHAQELHYDQVSFSVQAESELRNDRTEAILAVEAEDTDAAKVAGEINRAMAWALKLARKVEDVTFQTGDYQIYPVYDKSRLLHWRGSQTLILRSQKIETLNALVGDLQQRLQIKSMRFTPSPERQRSAETQLFDQVLEQFKERATRIQRDLGAKDYRVVHLNVENAGTPQPLARMAFAETAGVPVAGEAGTSRLQLAVHAVIQLQF